jgi:hypothetical protein
MSKKIKKNMIPIPTILFTIFLRIIFNFSLKVQIFFYKEKYIFKNDF